MSDLDDITPRWPCRSSDDVLADIDNALSMTVFGRPPFEAVGLVFVDVDDADEPPMA